MTDTLTPIIEMRAVSRQFGAQHVLRNVDMSVTPGETVVIIGESGCGKSVTIKLMMQLIRPTSGAVLWNGRPVHETNEEKLVRDRLKFGFLFQNAALFDSLSVYENVAFGLRENTQLQEEAIEHAVMDKLREVGLPDEVRGKKPAELSGGMRKRVGLARALVLNPEVMFYDEPTTGLDPVMSDVINELILQTRNQRPVTSIVITHDMRTVEKVADRIVMLYPLNRLEPDEDQVIYTGTVSEVFSSSDPRVAQFVRGEAGERLRELSAV